MRKLLLLLSLFASLASFGQKNEVDYQFINAALRQVRVYDSTYFLLHNTLYSCYMIDDYLQGFAKSLKGKIDPRTLRQLLVNSRKNSTKEIRIDSARLSKTLGARLIPGSFIDSLQRNENISRPLKKRLFYICSLPVFDNARQYAVIEFGGGTARMAMNGAKYLFKKTKTGWMLIATFGHWVS